MVDSHCHLADDAFASDLVAVVERAKAAGVNAALCIIDAASSVEVERAKRLAERWPSVRFGVGVHPHQAGQFADRLDAVDTTVTDAIARIPGARALGEIGLDNHYDFAPRDVQREVFGRQVRLARARDWPVVIHTREAEGETIAILREEGQGEIRGVFHCFTGDAAAAERALDLGFHVSFAGIVTFPKAESLRDAAKIVPADRLLAETDSPYLTPVPFRHIKRNEPARVTLVAAKLAEVRGETPEQVAGHVTRAFQALFRP
jgi:TatD DNase family protein